MKAKKSIVKEVLFLMALLLAMGCTKEDSGDPSDPRANGDGELAQDSGVSAEEIETYQGDIGVLIDLRDFARKGYEPDLVTLSTTATEDNYDQQLEVDPFTNQARLVLPIEDLSEDAEAELRDGVGLEVAIIDKNGAGLGSSSFSVVSFQENGTTLEISAASLPWVERPVSFNASIRHYVQPISPSGAYSSRVVWKPSSAQDRNVKLVPRNSTFNKGTTSEQFYIYKFPGTTNEFAIYSANTGRYLATDANDKTFRQSGGVSYPAGISDNSLNPVYRFLIQREQNGLYTIRDASGNPMKASGTGWTTNAPGASIQYFRIVSLDIEWQVTQLDTEYQQPIYPPAETSFGFNSTLINCGTGSLEQEVGIEKEVTTTYSSTYSETIGLSGRTTTSLETSVSATAEASFFGNGGSVTGEVSAGLEFSVEASSSSTSSKTAESSNTNSFFSRRTVTVPTGRASLVYDAYQTYSNVRVPYVKRLRLQGGDPAAGIALSGADISTQLYNSRFSGTLLEIGSDYVEVSIKGSMIMDNIVDTQTEVRDVPSNCDG